MRVVLISGSSRGDGNISSLISEMMRLVKWDLIDLNRFDFSYFDYQHNNRNDDFLKLMKQIISDYDILIFVTPVYWYSMSGIMKVFFDRLTDLLMIEKNLGRQLRGKKMAVMTSSVGENLGDSFWLPFIHTSSYLGMQYLGNLHTIADSAYKKDIENFIALIEGTDM